MFRRVRPRQRLRALLQERPLGQTYDDRRLPESREATPGTAGTEGGGCHRGAAHDDTGAGFSSHAPTNLIATNLLDHDQYSRLDHDHHVSSARYHGGTYHYHHDHGRADDHSSDAVRRNTPGRRSPRLRPKWGQFGASEPRRSQLVRSGPDRGLPHRRRSWTSEPHRSEPLLGIPKGRESARSQRDWGQLELRHLPRWDR